MSIDTGIGQRVVTPLARVRVAQQEFVLSVAVEVTRGAVGRYALPRYRQGCSGKKQFGDHGLQWTMIGLPVRRTGSSYRRYSSTFR